MLDTAIPSITSLLLEISGGRDPWIRTGGSTGKVILRETHAGYFESKETSSKLRLLKASIVSREHRITHSPKPVE